MRVLIADRNARLLESISRTFARQFTIRTAVSCEQCNALLSGEEFDLALISEKLADGPGLQLLAQIARTAPDTLRVFAARRSRLQILRGKLGPFGLFRTLSYPINPQELLSTLTLAQTGLAIAEPATDEAPEAPPPGELPPRPAAPAQAHPIVERISLTSADATFTVNVPKKILSQRRVRRSNSAPAHRPTSPARQAPAPESLGTARPAQSAPPDSPSTARQARKATPQPGANASQLSEAVPQPPRATPQQAPSAPLSARSQHHSHPARSQAAAVHSAVFSGGSQSQGGVSQHVSRSRRSADRPVVGAQPVYPVRSKIVLAATSVVVFIVTTLTLNLNDASVHVTRASTPLAKVELPPAPEPPPAALAPAFQPQPSVARRVEPNPPVDPVGQQVTASNPPVADPSTFGHEAYEVIYAN